MDNPAVGGGRRRGPTKHSAEDQALDQIAKEAEARLAARRQARAEAREIRMRELEKQQKEDENVEPVFDMYREPPTRSARVAATGNTRSTSLGGTNSYHSSRRSSEDSLEEGNSLRDVRQLKEVEEKFRKAMIQTAQLDNEKSSLTYQVELLKDRLDDLEESHFQLQREHKEKCREYDQLKRATVKLKEDLELYKSQLEERDSLIQEQGLMIVGDDQVSSEDESNSGEETPKKTPRRALVSIESAELLQSAGEGSLDVRLRKFAEEKNELLDQVRHLKLELEEERSRHKPDRQRSGGISLNGPDTDAVDIQREANKQLGDYKFKLQKAEQDVSTLQANVARLESQVIRYKSASETAEKVEDELKVEKRKLQREGSSSPFSNIPGALHDLPRKDLAVDSVFENGMRIPEMCHTKIMASEAKKYVSFHNPTNGLNLVSTSTNDQHAFKVKLDVKQFKPSELTVKTKDTFLIVEGKHAKRLDEHGFISKQFQYCYMLPGDVEENTVVSQLSSDGILTVSAPKKPLSRAKERIIPVLRK